MPLFEFDAGRQLEGSGAEQNAADEQVAAGAVATSRATELPPADPARLAQVIEDNLDGLVGEQVFPVVRSFSPAEPYLIALDPSGAPVVVEVVAHLDTAALMRCLDHAGAAGRMTRGQLAGAYPGGSSAFVADLSRFMDTVPVKRARLPRTGSRLIIICHRADESVLNAVDFLRQPSMPVEVLQLNLVNGLGGRRFIDLSPLVINPDSAPDRPQVLGATARSGKPAVGQPGVDQPDAPKTAGDGGSSEAPAPGADRRTRLAAAIAAAQQAVQRAEAVIALGVSDAAAPTSAGTTETRRQRRERLAAERAAEAAARRAAREQSTAEIPVGESQIDPLVDSALNELRGESAGESTARHLPTGLQAGDPLPAVVHPHSLPAGLTIDGVIAAGTDASDPLSWDTAQLPVVVEPVHTGPLPTVAPQSQPGPTVQRTPISEVHRVATHRGQSNAVDSTDSEDAEIDNRVDEQLIELAGRLGTDTALVWERPRRRQRFTATLDAFGTIHLGNGEAYNNPDAAARAAANSRSADGWNVWRLNTAEGPTLREAWRA